MVQVFQFYDDSRDALLIGESQRAASEGSPTSSHYHAEINVLRTVDHAFLQDPGRFVHHDQGHVFGEHGIGSAWSARAP